MISSACPRGFVALPNNEHVHEFHICKAVLALQLLRPVFARRLLLDLTDFKSKGKVKTIVGFRVGNDSVTSANSGHKIADPFLSDISYKKSSS